jgi:SRSO17 transposase
MTRLVTRLAATALATGCLRQQVSYRLYLLKESAEWPRGDAEPSKYWISTLPPHTSLKALVKMAKNRWIIERDYEELKQELGLGHFEGRKSFFGLSASG